MENNFFEQFQPHFTQTKWNKIENRFVSILGTFDKMLKKGGWNNYAEVSYPILFEAVVSYYLDLNRSKKFHRIEYADSHKRAAYLIFWLSIHRPIQLVKLPIEKADMKYLLINELFAIRIGIKQLKNVEMQDINNISDNYLRNFVYNLHYRNIQPSVLASEMFLLEKIIKDINYDNT